MIPRKLWDAAVSLDAFLHASHLNYCLIGGIALQRWGQPRQTNDVDATVFADFGDEQPVIQLLTQRFQTRLPDAAEFALQARVLLLADRNGSPFDISFGAIGFEERMIQRSSLWTTPTGHSIRTCSAEDLIVLKAFANRPQDWIDIAAVIDRQHSRLNRTQILTDIKPLADLKEDPEILQKITHLLASPLPGERGRG
ncbi:MAG: hypothetical protein ACKOEO_19165, partial [Planctomycetaceae bacterium]